MNKLATALVSLTLLAAAWPLAMGAQAESTATPMAFGTAANAIDAQRNAGVPADIGTFWVGPWTLKSGWGGPDYEMTRMKNAGVTPAIHYYYWGDDISQSCLTNGCWSDLHGAQKDQAGWDRLTNELIAHLNSQMGGKPVYILVETEFNKADVQYWEPLDAMLMEKAQKIKDGYPEAIIVLSLGNWNRGAWTTWDRAAGASDMIGIQGMRGSTRDSPSHYDDLYESTLAGAKDAQRIFSKPVMIQDLALSSYPEPEYLYKQESELKQFFDNIGTLKAAGVQAMLYRAWTDNPNMDLKNYYGEAERHWGLHQEHFGEAKPSGKVWIAGVKAERANPAPGGSAPAPAPPTGPFSAAFEPSANNNEWWVDVKVTSSNPIAKVEASHNGKPYVTLSKTNWGSYAKSFSAPAGGEMVFKATDSAGQSVSKAFPWLQAAEPAPLPAFSATFEPSKSNNEWWVDVKVASSSPITKVEASHDGKPFVALSKTNWGSYAKSFSAPAGGEMVFRATDSHGQTVSQGFPWLADKVNQAPTAALKATISGLTVSVDATGSSDPDGDALSYTIAMGDGKAVTGPTGSHTYAQAGDYTVVLTVSDGKASATASQKVTAVQPNRAPVAAFTASTDGLKLTVDASGSTDADGDALSYSYEFGDGARSTTKTATHAYSKAGDYTVKLTVSDGKASSTASKLVSVKAPMAFTADIQPTPNVNNWWVEVKASGSQPIVKVEAKAGTSSYVTLDKTSWGTYAKSFYVATGTPVSFRATAADGQTVTTDAKPWLREVSSFDATFAPKTQGNPWWVEVTVTGNEPIAKVEVKVNGGAYKVMEKTKWDSYVSKDHTPKGSKLVFRATSTSGATDVSSSFTW